MQTMYAPHVSTSEDWITRPEAAKRLGVSMQTLDRYVSRGRITKRQNELTKRVRLSADDVERVRLEREAL